MSEEHVTGRVLSLAGEAGERVVGYRALCVTCGWSGGHQPAWTDAEMDAADHRLDESTAPA